MAPRIYWDEQLDEARTPRFEREKLVLWDDYEEFKCREKNRKRMAEQKKAMARVKAAA